MPSSSGARAAGIPRPARDQARPGRDRRRLRTAGPPRAARSRRCSSPARTGRARRPRRLSAIALAAGVRTGLYTSPHLESVTERIRLGADDVSAGGARRRARRGLRGGGCRARGGVDVLRGDDGRGVRRLRAPRARAGGPRGRPGRPPRRDQRGAGDARGGHLDLARSRRRPRTDGRQDRLRKGRRLPRRPPRARGEPASGSARGVRGRGAAGRGGAAPDGRRDARRGGRGGRFRERGCA